MYKNIDYRTLFGPCIMNQYRKQRDERRGDGYRDRKLREKELFQMVDDYIEQA